MTDITGAAVCRADTWGYVEKKKRTFRRLIKENTERKWISNGQMECEKRKGEGELEMRGDEGALEGERKEQIVNGERKGT